MIRKIVSLLLILGMFNFLISAPKSNLELIYSLIEKSVGSIADQLPDNIERVNLSFKSSDRFSHLENRVIRYFETEDLLVKSDSGSNELNLIYTIENIDIDYPEIYRDGLLGSYKTERKVFLNVSYSLMKNDRLVKSNFWEETLVDTINYSEINDVESLGLEYTQAEKPPEPFFESLLEPVVAVGTLIVSIILLFTVRSK